MAHNTDFDDDLEYHMNRLRRTYDELLDPEIDGRIEDILEELPLPLVAELREHRSVVSLPSFMVTILRNRDCGGVTLYELLLEVFDWELINTVFKSRRTRLSHMRSEELLLYLEDKGGKVSLERGYSLVTRAKVRKCLSKNFKLVPEKEWSTQVDQLIRYSRLGIENSQEILEQCRDAIRVKRVKANNIKDSVNLATLPRSWDSNYDYKLAVLNLCLSAVGVQDVERLLMHYYRSVMEWDKGTSVDLASNFVVSRRIERDLPCCEMDWTPEVQFLCGDVQIRYLLRTSVGFQEIGGGQFDTGDDIYIVVDKISPTLKIRVAMDCAYAYYCPLVKTINGLRIEKILGHGALGHPGGATPGLNPNKYTIYRVLTDTFSPESLRRLLWVTVYDRDKVHGTRPFIVGKGKKYIQGYENSDVTIKNPGGLLDCKRYHHEHWREKDDTGWEFFTVIESLLQNQLKIEVLSRGEINQVNAWIRLRAATPSGRDPPHPPAGFVEDCGTLVKVNSVLLHSKKYYENVRDEVRFFRRSIKRNEREIVWRDRYRTPPVNPRDGSNSYLYSDDREDRGKTYNFETMWVIVEGGIRPGNYIDYVARNEQEHGPRDRGRKRKRSKPSGQND